MSVSVIYLAQGQLSEKQHVPLLTWLLPHITTKHLTVLHELLEVPDRIRDIKILILGLCLAPLVRQVLRVFCLNRLTSLSSSITLVKFSVSS